MMFIATSYRQLDIIHARMIWRHSHPLGLQKSGILSFGKNISQMLQVI
jgi:hypothetical protein